MSTDTVALGHDQMDDEVGGEHEHGVERLDLVRIGVVAAGALAVLWFGSLPAPVLLAFGAAVLAFGAWPVFREAVENLAERRMTMELSMVIALVAALLIGEVFVALVIAAFVLVAEVLEGLAVARGRNAIEDLLRYLPQTATVRRGAATEEVPLAAVVAGDLVLVNPGGSVPVDGIVTGGSSHVDEATITGEPLPVDKTPGDAVYAGTVNQLGALEIRAERIGRDSAFGKIIEAVEHAERSRAPIQKTADRYAGYLVYFALSAAAITFLLTRDIVSTISVVIVAGACGIAAGTPLAILGGIGRAAHQGSIIKGGRYLESLWAVDTVVLDKTGTLTYGTPAVSAVLSVDGARDDELLAVAAAAEARSEHPLARAIVSHARQAGIAVREPDEFSYLPGRGISAIVDGQEVRAGSRAFIEERVGSLAALGSPDEAAASEVVVSRGDQVLGVLLIADTLRDEAVRAVAELRGMGIHTVLLTGDRPAAAEAAARRLGVDAVHGGMLPDQKRDLVRRLAGEGRRVAMVGDGINDAPALAEAMVGVAMGSGTDVTRESAQIVLIGNDLAKFVETVRISRRTGGIIRQNFVGTIAVDTLGIVLAGFGLLGPVLAAVIHVVSELTFIANSARLLPAAGRLANRRHEITEAARATESG